MQVRASSDSGLTWSRGKLLRVVLVVAFFRDHVTASAFLREDHIRSETHSSYRSRLEPLHIPGQENEGEEAQAERSCCHLVSDKKKPVARSTQLREYQ